MRRRSAPTSTLAPTPALPHSACMFAWLRSLFAPKTPAPDFSQAPDETVPSARPSIQARVSLVATVVMLTIQLVMYVDAFLSPRGLISSGFQGVFFGVSHALIYTKILTLSIIIFGSFYYIIKGTPPEEDQKIMSAVRRSWIISLSIAWFFYLTVLIYNLLT